MCLQLEELSLTGEEHVNAWTVGIECVPVQWEKLTKLKSLQLRGHNLLSVRRPLRASLFSDFITYPVFKVFEYAMMSNSGTQK